MYRDFHGLKLQPFELTADPAFFYTGEDQCHAVASVEYAVRMKKGLMLLTGDCGSGKTMLGRVLAERLAGSAVLVNIRSAPDSARQLLRAVARGVNVAADNLERDQLLERIEAEAARHAEAGRPLTLIVDDSHLLSDEVLQQIRLLSDLEDASGKLVQAVLVAHDNFEQRLTEETLMGVRQRVVTWHGLRPLRLEETAAYLYHRLRIASGGAEPTVRFDADAVEEVHQLSGGLPRLINLVADHALLLAYVRSSLVIDRATVASVTLPAVNKPSPAPHDFVSYRKAA